MSELESLRVGPYNLRPFIRGAGPEGVMSWRKNFST